MQFLLKPLFLDQVNKYLAESHFSGIWPRFSINLQIAGILNIAFTYLHAQIFIWLTISFNTSVCTLNMCMKWRPVENMVIFVGFFYRVVFCTSRLHSVRCIDWIAYL